MGYHFTPTRITRIKKITASVGQGCGAVGTLIHYWWECEMIQLENNLAVPPVIKHRVTLWLYSVTAWFHGWKTTQVVKWISKMWYIHTMNCYSTVKRNEVLTHDTTWMNLKSIIKLSEKSQSYKTTYYMILFIWKSWIEKLIETEGRLLVSQVWEGVWGTWGRKRGDN